MIFFHLSFYTFILDIFSGSQRFQHLPFLLVHKHVKEVLIQPNVLLPAEMFKIIHLQYWHCKVWRDSRDMHSPVGSQINVTNNWINAVKPQSKNTYSRFIEQCGNLFSYRDRSHFIETCVTFFQLWIHITQHL